MKLPPYYLYKNKHRKRNHSKIPFIDNDFGTSSEKGVSRERFWGRSRGALPSSDADEPESNKFSAHFRARVAPLLAEEVEDIFLPAASTPAIEAFTPGLSPEDLVANFILRFKGLSRASS
jgi:hypothetical protein